MIIRERLRTFHLPEVVSLSPLLSTTIAIDQCLITRCYNVENTLQPLLFQYRYNTEFDKLRRDTDTRSTPFQVKLYPRNEHLQNERRQEHPTCVQETTQKQHAATNPAACGSPQNARKLQPAAHITFSSPIPTPDMPG